MRRRWPFLLLLFCLVSVAGFVTLRFLSGPPFAFLAGHVPVPLGGQGGESEMGHGEDDTFYSYKADYTELCRRAADELESLGFRINPPQTGSDYITWARGQESVTILNNARLDEVSDKGFFAGTNDERGWVRIHITGTPRTSIWRSFMSLFAF